MQEVQQKHTACPPTSVQGKSTVGHPRQPTQRGPTWRVFCATRRSNIARLDLYTSALSSSSDRLRRSAALEGFVIATTALLDAACMGEGLARCARRAALQQQKQLCELARGARVLRNIVICLSNSALA